MQVKHITLSLVILFLFFGCADVRAPHSDGGSIFQLPWYDKTNGYKLKKIKIKTLENIDHVSGSTAQFYVYPYLKNDKLTGPVPTARFTTTREGVVIPKDIITTQLFTVYAHLEKLREFDKLMGIDHLVKWPATVGVAVNYRDESGALVNNNAAYSSSLDAYLFMPYTDSKVPITVNGAVIGHEHFHSLFAKLVKYNAADSVPTIHEKNLLNAFELYNEKKMGAYANLKPAQIANIVLYKIMNEGLADFWGWLYTQNDNFVGQSLSQDKGARKIEKQNISLFTKDYLTQNYDAISDREIYQLGNIYARIFTNYVKNYSINHEVDIESAQKKIAAYLISALKEYNTQSIKINAEEQVIDPNLFFELFLKQINEMKMADCDYFSSVLSDKNDQLNVLSCIELKKGNEHALAVD